jgi:hypothetical protein
VFTARVPDNKLLNTRARSVSLHLMLSGWFVVSTTHPQCLFEDLSKVTPSERGWSFANGFRHASMVERRRPGIYHRPLQRFQLNESRVPRNPQRPCGAKCKYVLRQPDNRTNSVKPTKGVSLAEGDCGRSLFYLCAFEGDKQNVNC